MNRPSIRYLAQRARLDTTDRRLAALASIVGVDVAKATLPEYGTIGDDWLARHLDAPAVIASAETIASLLARNRAGLNDLNSLTGRIRFLMVYGLERCTPASARRLFGSSPMTVVTPSIQRPGERYELPDEGAAISLQLAGTSFETKAAGELIYSLGGAVLAKRAAGDSAVRIIDYNRLPYFTALLRSGSEIYYLPSSLLLDVNAPAPNGELPSAAYPGLLPWLLFLRRAAGEGCWHNHVPRASLIIDDPPLQPRYGFLSYSALVDAMRRAAFAASIAFIPWNHSRSSPGTVQLFQQNPSMLSLCVHGCDHTGGEFGSTDAAALRQKARIAFQRMEAHQRTTGIGWDPVMIFPQGFFSSVSLAVLKQEGFLAAVNSGIASVDRPETCRLADLLTPAANAPGGAPLFKRHYPRALMPFALDLFLGRPVLIGEHHTYFSSGYEKACKFVARLKAMDPRLTWAPLGETVCTAVQRRVTGSSVELRAYTDQTLVRKSRVDSTSCLLLKPESDPDSVCGVIVNGRPSDYRLTTDRIELPVDAPGDHHIEIQRRPSSPSAVMVPGWSYEARVAARRYLCGLRDNALFYLVRWIPRPLARRMIGAVS